jgi:hypothetical protein
MSWTGGHNRRRLCERSLINSKSSAGPRPESADLQTRTLLRTRPNPLPAEKILRLRGARPAGPPPPASARAGPGAAARRSHRCRLGRRPTRRAWSCLRPANPHDLGLRHHLGHRARRWRQPRRPPHHHRPRDYDQGQIAADGHHGFLDHLSQITWRETVAHQLSLDSCLSCHPRVECNLTLRAPRSDDCAIGRARTARSDAVRRFGTGVACRRLD